MTKINYLFFFPLFAYVQSQHVQTVATMTAISAAIKIYSLRLVTGAIEAAYVDLKHDKWTYDDDGQDSCFRVWATCRPKILIMPDINKRNTPATKSCRWTIREDGMFCSGHGQTHKSWKNNNTWCLSNAFTENRLFRYLRPMCVSPLVYSTDHMIVRTVSP